MLDLNKKNIIKVQPNQQTHITLQIPIGIFKWQEGHVCHLNSCISQHVRNRIINFFLYINLHYLLGGKNAS